MIVLKSDFCSDKYPAAEPALSNVGGGGGGRKWGWLFQSYDGFEAWPNQ